MREDGADEDRPPAGALRQLPRQHGNPRELADPAGEHRVREEADAEPREDVPETRVRRRHRLVDHGLPRECTNDDGEQVEADRRQDELPAHELERVRDGAPRGPVLPEQEDDARGGREHHRDADPGTGERPAHDTAATGTRRSASAS